MGQREDERNQLEIDMQWLAAIEIDLAVRSTDSSELDRENDNFLVWNKMIKAHRIGSIFPTFF